MADINALSKMPLFMGLTREQVGAFLREGATLRVSAGQPILVEGESGETMYILVDGSVEVTRRFGTTTDDRIGPQRKKTLLTLNSPQFFGEMSLLEDAERSATVTASTECEVLEFTREDFTKLTKTDIALGYQIVYNIALVLSGRIRGTNRDVIKLTAALSLALGNR
ncbi:MAG: cyclic nucleotide-binding domain-containing protein [Chloroflexi bacterium]|nr:cyclic nucleotide-binding domain-containing protein [Chloroflexota bacterium]